MGKSRLLTISLAVLFAIILFACESDNGGATDDDTDDDITDDDANDDDTDDDTGPYYDPTWAVPTEVLPAIRGLKVIRGIIHSHSIYSHDACDGHPEGNTDCLMELRKALCTTNQNYLMLTDHDDSFAEHEFPDVVLHLPEEGDEVLYDDRNHPYANRMWCDDDSFVTIFAGTENDVMPIHMHQHVEGTIQDRYALYGRSDPGVVDIFHNLGAWVLVNHPEGWSIPELVNFSPDGIEIFNLHAAIDPTIRPLLGVSGIDFIGDVLRFVFDENAHPNLVIMAFWPQTEVWNERWDALLKTQRCIGIAANDAHRNALPFNLSDGERADGYRRMFQFFSNHILVTDEEPESIEEALDSGRVYAAFEFLGFPFWFDFHATDGKKNYEMGDEVPLTSDLHIKVKQPTAFYIDPNGPQPEITTILYRIHSGGKEMVAANTGDIDYLVTAPGAYRAEVHIIPWHLEPWLGSDPMRYIHSYPWIYASPIYVMAKDNSF